MTVSLREGWTVLHGTLFGAALLLAFAGGLAGLYGLRPEWGAAPKIEKHILGLKIMVWGAALIAWGTVMTGTFIVYPWYGAAAPMSAEATLSPYDRLLANPVTADWNNFGMAWKQHVGWLAPIAATVVAFAVTYYGPQLAKRTDERRALMVFFVIAFAAAATAGVFGALLKSRPHRLARREAHQEASTWLHDLCPQACPMAPSQPRSSPAASVRPRLAL